PGFIGRLLRPMKVGPIKSQIRAAKTNREWRKVLELGEEVLRSRPDDVETHIDMSEAAEQLDLPNLAMWVLQQGRELLAENLELLRAMAHLHAHRGEWKRALVLWEMVRQAKPEDAEARHQIQELSGQ